MSALPPPNGNGSSGGGAGGHGGTPPYNRMYGNNSGNNNMALNNNQRMGNNQGTMVGSNMNANTNMTMGMNMNMNMNMNMHMNIDSNPAMNMNMNMTPSTNFGGISASMGNNNGTTSSPPGGTGPGGNYNAHNNFMLGSTPAGGSGSATDTQSRAAIHSRQGSASSPALPGLRPGVATTQSNENSDAPSIGGAAPSQNFVNALGGPTSANPAPVASTGTGAASVSHVAPIATSSAPDSATGTGTTATPSTTDAPGRSTAKFEVLQKTNSPATSTDQADASKKTAFAATDQAVLEYLRQKGMNSAVLELQSKLKERQQPQSQAGGPTNENSTTGLSMKEQLEQEDDLARNQRTALTKSTGGGYGYDRDAAVPIVQWGVPDTMKPLGNSTDIRGPSKAVTTTNATKDNRNSFLGEHEAKSYLDAFCALQIWVLTLPDDDVLFGGTNVQPAPTNVVAKARAVLATTADGSGLLPQGNSEDSLLTANNASAGEETLVNIISELATSSNKKSNAAPASVAAQGQRNDSFHLPPSAKPELLAVTFALLVHTYCELLEVGMETTAHILRNAFQPVYEPLYGQEWNDLYQCTTTEDIVKLNTHNSQHMEHLANLKSILVQIAGFQLKQEELSLGNKGSNTNPTNKGNNLDHATQQAQKVKYQEISHTIHQLQKKHKELSQRASAAFDRMYDVPFLRRARAVRWQLSLSATSYGLLCSFLNNSSMSSSSLSLLAMSTLLQTKCELHVEQRNPLPFTPACVFEVIDSPSQKEKNVPMTNLNENAMVNWAAPSLKTAMCSTNSAAANTTLPFPKYHLDEEYENERLASRDKGLVEFNRAVLVNGFRRLEALERKRTFDVMANAKKAKPSLPGSRAGGHSAGDGSPNAPGTVADPLEPSILLSTLCGNSTTTIRNAANSSGAANSKNKAGSSKTTNARHRSNSLGEGRGSNKSSTSTFHVDGMWEESGVGLTCARLCPPDGRRVAVGCDDAAIRIWDLSVQRNGGEPCQVLLGHKNGFPVFDLSWNKDGRSLLSAGGDGSVRLWDTMAQGPFGSVGTPTKGKPPSPTSSTGGGGSKSSKDTKDSSGGGGSGSANSGHGTSTSSAANPNKKGSGEKITSAAAREALEKASKNLARAQQKPEMTVPGFRQEMTPQMSGAALAVYRGHAPNTPVWSVAFAPCGYYFASAGADATARLWTTDRPVPVRVFTGHTSNSVHSVVFHPNCNYVLTGSDDKTARLWDIQTGRCVRLLTGCPTGIHNVEIDPSGQYAAGADSMGTIHLWDLASGKKVTEFRHKNHDSSVDATNMGMIHSLSFSSCGSSLASGGDDRRVRLWDIKQVTGTEPCQPVIEVPYKSFPTRRTILMDLKYTKRNLLLSVGKYITAVPIIPPVAD